jgi:hypothetical protein
MGKSAFGKGFDKVYDKGCGNRTCEALGRFHSSPSISPRGISCPNPHLHREAGHCQIFTISNNIQKKVLALICRHLLCHTPVPPTRGFESVSRAAVIAFWPQSESYQKPKNGNL